jgi:transcriptional regulator with XRE-family HTH domain
MNRIKEVLKNKGISQTWLAEQTDKSYTTINEYTRNKRQPSLEDLYKIAEILNVQVSELLIERNDQ